MGRAGRLLAALVALAGLLWRLYLPDSGDASGVDDPATITDYSASLVVDADGTLRRHRADHHRDALRAARDLPVLGRRRRRATPTPGLVPEDIEVTAGRRPGPSTSPGESRRYRVAKIGRRRRRPLTPGQHVYEISYRIDGALAATDARGAALHLGRRRPRLADADRAQRGPGRAAGRPPAGCGLLDGHRRGAAGRLVTRRRRGQHRARSPPRHRGDRARAARHGGARPGHACRGRCVDGDPLAQRRARAVLLLLLSAAAAATGWVLARHAREPQPGSPGALRAAGGARPGAGRLRGDRAGARPGAQATLLYQAEQGLTRLEQTDDDVGRRGHRTRGAVAGHRPGHPRGRRRARGRPARHAVHRRRRGRHRQAAARREGRHRRHHQAVGARRRLRAAQPLGDDGQAAARRRGRARRPAASCSTPSTSPCSACRSRRSRSAGSRCSARGVGTRRTPSGRELWSRAGGLQPDAQRRRPAQERFDFCAAARASTPPTSPTPSPSTAPRSGPRSTSRDGRRAAAVRSGSRRHRRPTAATSASSASFDVLRVLPAAPRSAPTKPPSAPRPPVEAEAAVVAAVAAGRRRFLVTSRRLHDLSELADRVSP